MINEQLLNPKNILIVGGSNDIHKPGGKILKNIIDGNYKGELLVVNPKEDIVQGIKTFHLVDEVPNIDLAIIAIASKYCKQTVETLAFNKNTKAFIIISAGFSEEGKEGAQIEKEIVEIINKVNGCLIGPNCIGFLNSNYSGIFTLPIPALDTKGCDMATGSGATAVFILDKGVTMGLRFSSLYSVGNSAQMGVEEIVKYWDESFNPQTSSKVKLLYLERIDKPEMLLKHAKSLINKGCKIAAIKAGSSEEGSRAASSHTGALASSDIAVSALFEKAGIVRCFSREELITVGAIFSHKEFKGNKVALITHAGGPAVIMTDVFSENGFKVPQIPHEKGQKLLEKLYHGSSVNNPIDFLATGTAQQMSDIIDFCDNELDDMGVIINIYGKPGLFDVYDSFDVILEKTKSSKKPIFTVFPTTIVGKDEIEYLKSKGGILFYEEAMLAKCIAKIYNTPKPSLDSEKFNDIDKNKIRKIIDSSKEGYLQPYEIQQLLDASGITRAKEYVVSNKKDAVINAKSMGYPLVMKVIGPIHKSDVGGVVLNVKDEKQVSAEFNRMIKIKDTTAILMQPMLSGTELFVGAKYEKGFGHLIMCGLGGIFIEVLKDVKIGLAPLNKNEASSMIKNLKGYGIIKGVRGQEGIDENKFSEIILRLSNLLMIAPEIYEMDLNPLLGNSKQVIAVDARINIKK